MTAESHPTVAETASRLWNNLPSLWKVLIPALAALLIVLLPANLLISSRFYAITTDNLRADHQARLAEIGTAFDDLLNKQSFYLTGLASSDKIKACAPTACASAGQNLFVPELTAQLRQPDIYAIEVGFIDPNGQETARAMRSSGNTVVSPGETPLFKTDPVPLQKVDAGQPYVFPIQRDVRLSAAEAYQQPVLRMAVPVIIDGERKGYVTSVLSVDDFFAQNFVYSDQRQTFLLDTDRCLVASSDPAQRADLYKTWRDDPARPCFTDLQLEDWDTTVQRYKDAILSTKVIHGALSTSGQTWTIVIQQPSSEAYGQANTLQTLLMAAHLFTIGLVALLIAGADRATKRLLQAAQHRNAEHARDMRFNPYSVGTPIEEPQQFFGRTAALAQVIGAGVMGGDDVVITGDRGIGKTSLLRQVERRLRDRRVSDPVYAYWPVSLSVQGVPADQFYLTLMDQILRDVPDHTTRTSLRYHNRPATYGVEDFREDINEVLALPDTLLEGRQTRLVLCLDNVHVWFSGAPGYDPAFIDAFRDMLSDVGNLLKLIAVGTHIPESAFGGAVTFIRLGPLEPHEAEQLIRRPAADYYTFTDEAVRAIQTYSDNLPMELQQLARHAVQVMFEQDAELVGIAQVERALQHAVADWEPTYRLLWNGGVDNAGSTVERLNDEVRRTMLTVGSSSEPIPPAVIMQLNRSQLDDISYTDGQGNLYLITIFKTWLKTISLP
ncbi:MAG: AAA family ATPase [Anaerolineae bacterium]|nr:AAA family ATPase [Anaerolineae bacterium]